MTVSLATANLAPAATTGQITNLGEAIKDLTKFTAIATACDNKRGYKIDATTRSLRGALDHLKKKPESVLAIYEAQNAYAKLAEDKIFCASELSSNGAFTNIVMNTLQFGEYLGCLGKITDFNAKVVIAAIDTIQRTCSKPPPTTPRSRL